MRLIYIIISPLFLSFHLFVSAGKHFPGRSVQPDGHHHRERGRTRRRDVSGFFLSFECSPSASLSSSSYIPGYVLLSLVNIHRSSSLRPCQDLHVRLPVGSRAAGHRRPSPADGVQKGTEKITDRLEHVQNSKPVIINLLLF